MTRSQGLRGEDAEMVATPGRASWIGLAAAVALCLAGPLHAAGPGAYALIVNGDEEYTHRHNVRVAVRTLLQIGYSPHNVFVLMPGAATLDREVGHRGPATRAGWKSAIAALERRLGPEDTLLVYLTGHGNRRYGESVLMLERGWLAESNFAKSLERLSFGRLIVVADQCYSGGFGHAVERLRQPTVAVTGSDATHETRCQPFIRPFWRAALDGASDRDGDGVVTVAEAFAVAARLFDRYVSSHLRGLPQIRNERDPGLGFLG